ncbi:MAG: uroporphyrinogen-III C-methyltransferase [Actinobacteria bacterium]|nr:uroporphyrinogen-III C-methyltransferase [Actinomycetota bacterium]
MKSKGMVYLVGAGPGDPGLITVKGRECVQKAEVIVYDRLAGGGILAHARKDAELIYVGKGPERHTLRQEEINSLLVEKASSGKTVTRLKGGDPFVFGRGGEEAEALHRAGLIFEIVPGITSAVAVPAYAGIPVTHRGIASGFSVITGNEDPEKEGSDIDWPGLARVKGTLVFLMGMSNLPSIAAQLIKNGKPGETPVAVIMWGTRTSQRTLVANLDNVARRAEEEGFMNPSVILVGGVVALRETLNWFEKKPLFGCRVLVTRSREQASMLSGAIEELGGEAVEFPTIKIEEPEDYGPLDRAIGAADYRWIIFTSANGVVYFFNRMFRLGKDIRELKGVSICAIGPKTREALEGFGIRVEYVPSEYRAEEIAAGLKGKIAPGERVLLPRADIARKALAEMLVKEGAHVDEVVAYRTVAGGGGREMVRSSLEKKEIDYITFTSSSTVKNFVGLLGEKDPAGLIDGARVACIGPVTAETARNTGIGVDIEARSYTIDGLVEAILEDRSRGMV